jgi:Flp pilus assembly protein TadD
LAHHRSRRTSNAELLAADLEAFVAGRAVVATPPSVVERLLDLWTFRRPWILSGALLVVLVLLSIPAFEARQRRLDREAEARVGEVLGAWISGEDEAGVAAARSLFAERKGHAFGALLLALAEDREPPDSPEVAVQAAADGLRKVRARRPQDAITDFQRASVLAPASPVPVVLLARAAERADDRALAAREYTAASKMLPACAAIQSRLASNHYALGNDEESILAARRAVALEPENGRHWSSLARSLSRVSKPTEEAVEAARKGVELSGDSATVLQLSILAASYDGIERHEEAREVLRKLIKSRPKDPRSYYNLAYSYMLDHHLPEAREAYLQGIGVGEGSRGKSSLAWLYAGSNSAECEECRRAYAEQPGLLDPDHAERLALEALDANDSTFVPDMAANVALATGRRSGIRGRIESLQANEERDEMIVAFEKALRRLR